MQAAPEQTHYPPLHSPALSSSSADVDDPLRRAQLRPRSPSTSTSSSSHEEPRLSFPPPPQPLEYEVPAVRRPLPIPPTLPATLKRPPLPAIPTTPKGKGRPLVMSEEKQAYARALGLDTLVEAGAEEGEEEEPTSPGAPPTYVNLDADAREGLSKSLGRREEETEEHVDEKGRAEVARVAEVQEAEAEEELDRDSFEEKARMAREEDERSEEERVERDRVETAELAKEVAQLELGRAPPTPPPPMSPGSPIPAAHQDIYPIDSKERSPQDRSRESPSDSLFDSVVDDVPSYAVEASPPRRQPTRDGRYAPPSQDYGSFPFSPHHHDELQRSPRPAHQRYATEPTSSAYPVPPPAPQLYLMFSSPPPPAPTSYVLDRLRPSEEETSRPGLTRHMSLQPAASASLYPGARLGQSSAAYAPSTNSVGGGDRRPPASRGSIGPGAGGGFYGSGIGYAMHKELDPVYESQSVRSPSPPRRSPASEPSEFGEAASSYSRSSHHSRMSAQWSTAPLAPPHNFAAANPAGYRQHLAAQPSFHHQPTSPGFASAPLPQQYASPTSQQYATHSMHPPPPSHVSGAPSALPVVHSSALREPAGYYTLTPGSAPIPFYNTSPHSAAPPGPTVTAMPQHAPSNSYFGVAPAPSHLPPPPAPHMGYGAYLPSSHNLQQQHQYHSGPPIASPPVRPASASRRALLRFGRGRSVEGV